MTNLLLCVPTSQLDMGNQTLMTDDELTQRVTALGGQLRTVVDPITQRPCHWTYAMLDDVMIGCVEFPSEAAKDAFTAQWKPPNTA